MAADRHMPPRQRRDPVGARTADVPVRADAKPAQVDQTESDRRDTLAVELLLVEMLRHGRPQLGKLLGEADQLVVLRLLLCRSEIGVVEVLLPPGLVEPGRLELGRRARRDPDLLPRRRDCELLDPLELRGVANRPTPPVEIVESILATPSRPRHAVVSCPGEALSTLPADAGRAHDRRPRGRPDRPGAPGRKPARARAGGDRRRAGVSALRPLARKPQG